MFVTVIPRSLLGGGSFGNPGDCQNSLEEVGPWIVNRGGGIRALGQLFLIDIPSDAKRHHGRSAKRYLQAQAWNLKGSFLNEREENQGDS
jgi:hypothetical protein